MKRDLRQLVDLYHRVEQHIHDAVHRDEYHRIKEADKQAHASGGYFKDTPYGNWRGSWNRRHKSIARAIILHLFDAGLTPDDIEDINMMTWDVTRELAKR